MSSYKPIAVINYQKGKDSKDELRDFDPNCLQVDMTGYNPETCTGYVKFKSKYSKKGLIVRSPVVHLYKGIEVVQSGNDLKPQLQVPLFFSNDNHQKFKAVLDKIHSMMVKMLVDECKQDEFTVQTFLKSLHYHSQKDDYGNSPRS